MIGILTAFGIFLGGQPAAKPPTSVCAVVATPTAFHNKEVTMRATILPTRHGIGLIDSRCPDALIALGDDQTDRETGPNAHFYEAYWANYPRGKAISVTIKGTFWYRAGRYPGQRVDKYLIKEFTVGPKLRAR